MTDRGDLASVFRDLGLPSLFLGALGFLVLWVIGVSVGLDGWWNPGSPRAPLANDLVSLGVYASFIAAIAVQFARRRRDPRPLWWPLEGGSPLDWTWALGLIVAMVVVSVVVGVADDGLRAAWWPSLRDQPTVMAAGSPLTWLTVVCCAPVVEEVVFRGYLLHRWALRWGPTVGLVASSVVFAVLHPNPVGHFLGAMILGLVTLRTGSLAGSTVIHLGNNLLALGFGVMFPPAPGPAEALTGGGLVVATVLAAGVTAFFVWGFLRYWPRKAQARVFPPPLVS